MKVKELKESLIELEEKWKSHAPLYEEFEDQEVYVNHYSEHTELEDISLYNSFKEERPIILVYSYDMG